MVIVLEGIDGSGKSEQSKLLGKACSAVVKDVVVMPHPKGTKIGLTLYEAMKSATNHECEVAIACAMHLSISDLVEEYRGKKDSVLILDRYFLSTLVYQSPSGASEEMFWLCVRGMPKPDLTFVLSPPLGVIESRLKARGSEVGEEKFESNLPAKYAMYSRLAADHGAVVVDEVDLNKTTHLLFEEVSQLLRSLA